MSPDQTGPDETFAPGAKPAREDPGTVIGRYQLVRKLAEGGMGEVWLAEQVEPVRRRVALKLVKSGMNSREVIARFESERQALALMDHPAIAKVFDAGSAPDGVPYFVMEYVDGVQITNYCAAHRLTLRERLELFVHVCEGVQHAHQKAILHRDLKPSNILVTEVDGKAVPKIIDFGIAKALGQKLTADAMATEIGALVGTPAYMSPEQALTSGQNIDTRTDVYSLGVIFYELLTGALPLELRRIPPYEFLRRMRDVEPPKPSTMVRTQAAAAVAEAARQRQSEAPGLARQMRGELDSIALKALEKDPARRYGSPAEFAADIQRYLNHEAVLAVPQSAAYRAGKLARRHRVALSTACVLLVVIIAAAGISIRESIRATREAAIAKAVNDFLQNDLLAQASAARQSGPNAKPDPDLKVRTALDRAAARIPGKFGSQPEVEAAIRDTIGQTYMDLGLYPQARAQLERALELRRRVLGPRDPAALRTLSRLGFVAHLQGKYGEAEALVGQALDMQRRELGAENSDTLSSMNSLATIYSREGKFAKAGALDSQTLEMRRRKLGPDNPETLRSMTTLSYIYAAEGKFPQAEALDRETLEIRRRVMGAEHPETLSSMNDLAADYEEQGKYAQAELLESQLLEIQRRVLGPEHPSTLLTMNNLAYGYEQEGKYAEAETLLSQTLEIQQRSLGAEHPDTLRTMNNLAAAYNELGKYAEAEAMAGRALDVRRRLLGAQHRSTLASMDCLGDAYANDGKFAQAEAMLGQALEGSRRVLGAEHPDTLNCLSDLAWVCQLQGKYAMAEKYAGQALEGRRHALGSDNAVTLSSAADVALACVSQQKFADAEPLARAALESFQKKEPDDWQRFRAQSLLGAALAGEKKFAEAEPLLVEGYQGMLARRDRMAVPDRYHLERARAWLVEMYQAWGKPAKAAEWKRK